ncbi:3-hydroxyacyl-CoA dehydrogenase NAD-binding domain-containing protein [Altericista sp. CCNU0014]|uniref:3-hydroxyacyl-CoA dehydrogenase NAD-binding domain-containing protein n=1 Tax=Altericista sp. CCNU0014 TaxID=3082949 RepID=UPI00384F2CEC
MLKPFRTAAVLGAGVMGTQIAAHLANAGLTVHLLDIAATAENKNAIVESAFKKGLKQSPPIFFTEKTARRVTLGNFEEHLDRLADVDWIVEVVVENLAIKQQLMGRLESIARADAVISTNTSGLPIHAIVEGRSESFRKRFLGTHFFNPPRYLKLLELIPTVDTAPQVLERMQNFGELHLGKGVVVAKDTPNFIANRIGTYVTLLGLRALTDKGYTIEEIDTLTGPLVGRPKSATFRTADLVGLDTLTYVVQNLYPAITDDERREVFEVPELLRKLVETGTLGAKTGQGFYKKQKSQILSLNPATLDYELPQPMNLPGLETIARMPKLSDRLRALYHDTGRAGTLFRSFILETLSYSANRIPEITDRPSDLDRAMRWGFGWELGPFETWDALGFETVLADMKTAGLVVPAWVEALKGTGEGKEIFERTRDSLVKSTPNSDIDLKAIGADATHILWQNSEAALLDIGDGVGLYEFRSKGNTLSLNVVKGLSEVLDLLEINNLKGLVIGNSSAHFSGGANLAEMGMMAQSGSLDGIANLIVTFQTLLQRIYYFPKPIVAAVQGRALGGGCELVMACPNVVAAAETYIGLVEVSVGLIPGAGGIMRMTSRVAERAASENPSHVQPFLKAAFETIATAKVSSSAYEGQALGFLPPTTQILMNGDRRLAVAKSMVLHLAESDYVPPPELNAIQVLGRPARALLDLGAYTFEQSGYASEHDRYLANRLAYVMTGGDLTAPAFVHENYLLELERENFIPLLSLAKTQERIAHMLKTKKPLRN